MFNGLTPATVLVALAAFVWYSGTRLMWRTIGLSLPRPAVWRGVTLAIPLAILAGFLVLTGERGAAVTLLLSASVLVATLGIGSAALAPSLPSTADESSDKAPVNSADFDTNTAPNTAPNTDNATNANGNDADRVKPVSRVDSPHISATVADSGTGVEVARGVASPALRFLPPLCIAVCLAGFNGHLRLLHAGAIFTITTLFAWTHLGGARPTRVSDKPASPRTLVRPIIALVLATAGIARGLHLMHGQAVLSNIMPIVVLLLVLPLVGLLGSEMHDRRQKIHENGSNAVETVVIYIMSLLGVALPLIIVLAHVVPPNARDLSIHSAGLSNGDFSTQSVVHPATAASTTVPTTLAEDTPLKAVLLTHPIVMPLLAWRVDSILLVVLSVMLLPAGIGRYTIGRLEGVMLVLLCGIYMFVIASTGRL